MPTVDLVARYQVCAAHRLARPDWNARKNQEVFGKCARVHGHEYHLELVITGQLNPETGMLINAFDVDRIVRGFLEKNLDHKFLNEDVDFFRDTLPTAEWIAVWVYRELKDSFESPVCLKKVRVLETPELAAEYPAG